LEGFEVTEFVVGCAFLPATEEDADPFVSQGADDDPVSFVSRLLHLVEGASPQAMADRFVGVLDEALLSEAASRISPRRPPSAVALRIQSLWTSSPR
jgi:hypothetical protein